MDYQEKQQHAETVINTIRKKTDRVLLFYSAGKDSICLLDMLAEKFEEVVAVFMYFVKDLEHLNRFMIYSQKKYPNVKFIQIPHWSLSKIHATGLYCSPRKVRQVMFADVINAMKEKTGIEYAFIGEKTADNMTRRIKLRQYELEAISGTKNVYPLSAWKDKDVKFYIKKKKLPQPINYGVSSRSSGMGFNVDVYVWLRKFYPEDLKKILNTYPLSEKLLFDYDEKQKRENGKKDDKKSDH